MKSKNVRELHEPDKFKMQGMGWGKVEVQEDHAQSRRCKGSRRRSGSFATSCLIIEGKAGVRKELLHWRLKAQKDVDAQQEEKRRSSWIEWWSLVVMCQARGTSGQLLREGDEENGDALGRVGGARQKQDGLCRWELGSFDMCELPHMTATGWAHDDESADWQRA